MKQIFTLLMELDQLYKRMDYSPKERLHLLNKHKEIIATRDDLYLEYATLLNLTGEYEQAMQLIDQRQFHPWGGGEKVKYLPNINMHVYN